jgi:hypothetical protein
MVDTVVITWRTPSLIAASVLDPEAGVVDVRLADGLWTCACRQEFWCCHVSALKSLTEPEVVA